MKLRFHIVTPMVVRRYRSSFVHGLTPLLRDICFVISQTAAGARIGRGHRERDAGGGVCDAPSPF